MVINVNIPNARSSGRHNAGIQPAFGNNNDNYTIVQINNQVQELRNKGDLIKYADYLRKRFPAKEKNYLRGVYVKEYFHFVQSRMKQAFGTELCIELPEEEMAVWFNTLNPKCLAYIHESLKKHQELDRASSLGAQNSKPLAFPAKIIIGHLEGNDDGKYKPKTKSIRLSASQERGPFNSKIDPCKPSRTLEHELEHFFEDIKDKLYSPCSYLNILTPEEKVHYCIFEKFYKQYFDEVTSGQEERLRIFETVLNRDSFTFPYTYDKNSRTLFDLRNNYDAIKFKLKETLGPEFEAKTSDIIRKLTNFSTDTHWNVSQDSYHFSTPAETRAEAAAIRATGNSYSRYHLLPLTHGYEKMLAKIGMPPPKSYTILDDIEPDYLLERARDIFSKTCDSKTTEIKLAQLRKTFGTEFVKRATKKCLKYFRF